MFKQRTLFETFNKSPSSKANKKLPTVITNKYSDENGYNKLLIMYKSNKNVSKYLKSLTDREKIVLNIAYVDLESSFDIEKSQGYKTWLSMN